MKRINIAIDGHSSCGKGTLARHLAQQLGYVMIDSGAMYRAVTLAALRAGADITNEKEIEALLPGLQIGFQINDDNARSEVLLNGVNEEKSIRTMEVAAAVSSVSKHSAVRRFLVDMQRQMGRNKGVVMDGRDIGTIVFPDAELKIFMTASPEIRAGRRFRELQQTGTVTTLEEVLENLNSRDQQDSSRADSPLRMAEDARLLDNSSLGIEEQAGIALTWAREAMEGNGIVR